MLPTRVDKWLSRQRWDLNRFGITPAGVLHRLRPPEAPRILSISIPKSGTHLLERILCLHPLIHRRLVSTFYAQELPKLERTLARQRPGELLCAHVHHDGESARISRESGARLLLMVRDPRDIVISEAHYTFANQEHQRHERVRNLSLRERMELFIEGDPDDPRIVSIGRVMGFYAGWLDEDAIVVRFEELIDPNLRRARIRDLYEGLGLPADEPLLDRVLAQAYSPVSVTFRKGRSGEWRDNFDDDLIERFNRAIGPYMELFGYQKGPVDR